MPAHTIGLDITPTALVAVSLRKKGKLRSVEHVALRSIEHGIVSDGEVHDVDRLAAAIADMWAVEQLKAKAVTLGIANQRTLTRIVELPKLKKGQVRDAIGFEVDDILPIPLEESVWDYHTVGEFPHPDSGAAFQRHIVVMTYRESVERYREAIEKAGLKLANIDLAAFALMRAGLPGVKAALQVEPGADATQPLLVGMCHIGPTSTNVVISRDGICEMNRLVGFGVQTFSQGLVEQFGWGRQDADRVVYEAGILPLGGIESPGDPYTDSRMVMQHVADRFAQEIGASLDYYHHHSQHGERIGHVVLSGDGALLRGIEERFAATLELPVSIADTSTVVDAQSLQSIGANHAHLVVAIGLGLQEAA